MQILLEKMEQCLYDLKHNKEYNMPIKNAILDTEIALEALIRVMEKYDEETNSTTDKH